MGIVPTSLPEKSVMNAIVVAEPLFVMMMNGEKTAVKMPRLRSRAVAPPFLELEVSVGGLGGCSREHDAAS
jgi:hypothetical protein